MVIFDAWGRMWDSESYRSELGPGNQSANKIDGLMSANSWSMVCHNCDSGNARMWNR